MKNEQTRSDLRTTQQQLEAQKENIFTKLFYELIIILGYLTHILNDLETPWAKHHYNNEVQQPESKIKDKKHKLFIK